MSAGGVQGDKTQEEILQELGAFLDACGSGTPGHTLVSDWSVIRKARDVPAGHTGPVHHDTYYLGNGKRYRSRLEVARAFSLTLPDGGVHLPGSSKSASGGGSSSQSAGSSAPAGSTGLSHAKAVQSLDFEGAPKIDWSTTPAIAGFEEHHLLSPSVIDSDFVVDGRSPLTARVVPTPIPFSYSAAPLFGASPPIGWGPVGAFLCMLELRESIGFEAYARAEDVKDSPLKKCETLHVDYDANVVRFKFGHDGAELTQEFKHVKRRIALLPPSTN